ncbi:MAG: flagellar hook-associated protein 3 [Treponema sp.]|nr:flagellar hook-associated protein 3 [Treponema sp.]
MKRVSTDMLNADTQYYLRRQEDALRVVNDQLASGNRITRLRDDPLSASHAVRYQSFLARLERFEQNSLFARDHFRQVDIQLQRGVEVMQRIRELAVTGAHGTFTADDTRNMGVEVNELLKELVAIANSVGPDGKQLFAGDKAFTEPFRIVEGTVAGGRETLVVNVEYRGAGPARSAEISNGNYTVLDIGGGEAFWAERMQIYSQVDASDWRAAEDGAFFINGYEISVFTGDTLPAIVSRINESGAPVRASVDPQSRGLMITGTNPHLIKMEDGQGSTTLQDLGIIQFNNDPSAPNWSPSARVAGGSAFDMVIRLRDALFRGDTNYIGGLGIVGIDLALDNMLTRLTDIGSRQERAMFTWQRLNQEIPNVNSMLAREASTDMAEAAMDLGMMDFTHRAALQTAARLLPVSLLDFLR